MIDSISSYNAENFFIVLKEIERTILSKGYYDIRYTFNLKGFYVNVFYYLTYRGKKVKSYSITLIVKGDKRDIIEFDNILKSIPTAQKERYKYMKEHGYVVPRSKIK